MDLHERNEKQLEIVRKVTSALQMMENFSRTKKNTWLRIGVWVEREVIWG